MDAIRVRVADPDSGRVVLWERHPDHPGGEIWLSGAGEFDVAATPAVLARLRDGRLVAVEVSRVEEVPAAAPTPEPKGTGRRPEKDPQAVADVPAVTPPAGGRKDAPNDENGEGQVLPAEEPAEDVSIVTRTTGPGAPKSRANKRPARGGL